MAPMPLTGTIGTTSSAKTEAFTSHRRSLPEPVVSFQLPVVKRALPSLEKQSRKGKNVVKEEEANAKEEKGEAELTIESSLILLQSLRQSRLIHLTAFLPYLSTRHRTSTKYHPAPANHPFPGGLNPSTTPHSLVHLGRADVRTGPLLFPKTRFGEARVEGGLQDARGSALLKGGVKNTEKVEEQSVGPSTSTPSKTKTQTTNSATPTTEGAAAQPPIDDAVVQAVSAAAQKDPKLQTLLHTAANGKATPEELRELAKFISKVSEGLNKDKVKETAAPPPQPSKPTPAAPSASNATRNIPPPQSEPPPYPPIITVEFRENPSARFILPLWRGCAVERNLKGDERTIKVTMLLPAIGSTSAARAAANFETTKAEKEKEVEEQNSPKTSPMNPPTKEQLTAPAPRGAETHAVTWTISGEGEMPLPDGIWHTFGRVSGVKTIVNGAVMQDTEQTEEVDMEKFIEKLRASKKEYNYTPQLQLTQGSVPRDLSDHLTDKFAPRMQTLISKPIVKLKRGEADEEDVELVRDSSKRGWSSAGWTGKGGEEKRKKLNGGGVARDDQGEGEDSIMSIGVGDESGAAPPSKPKRKRHVAKFNPDGTLKLCQACGTNSTPMWRRGPAGKSTLCNACGAKWKVGRLVVPSEVPSIAAPPPPPPQTMTEVENPKEAHQPESAPSVSTTEAEKAKEPEVTEESTKASPPKPT